MAEPRDRDELGRPRNARPRDHLGRLLARDDVGGSPAPPAPVVTDLRPDLSLVSAQVLLDAGQPFAAHEVLEAQWHVAPAGERELWRGLAQLAVGFTHLLRGNPVGARRLLLRGRDRLVEFAEAPPHDVDVAGLVAWADRLVADQPPAPVPPRLLGDR